MAGLLRLYKYFLSLTAAGAATTTVANPNTRLKVNMAGATGVQTVVLPSNNCYAGEACGVLVTGAVAVQTVLVQSPAGTTIDTFAASTNGARVYVFNGTAFEPAATPA